jgi:hypothetical protein
MRVAVATVDEVDLQQATAQDAIGRSVVWGERDGDAKFGLLCWYSVWFQLWWADRVQCSSWPQVRDDPSALELNKTLMLRPQI